MIDPYLENSTLSAPNDTSRCTSGLKIDSGHDYSTNVGDTVAGNDSSSRDCVFEQPDPGHSDMPHTSKIEHVRSVDGKFHCNLCHFKFTHAFDLQSHLLRHSERPFVCTVCGRAFARKDKQKRHESCHERLRNSKVRFVCKGELSAQPARAWGCGLQFRRPSALASHFNSYGNVGRACIIPLLDKAYVEGKPTYTFPSVLLTQYPVLKDFTMNQISAWQDPPIEGASSSRSNDSGYASYHSEGRSNYKVRHVSETNSFAQKKARTKDGNGHLSDSLSPDQSSSNAGSENEHDDISEASILDCPQRALIARLMDEICSSFFYQISHRPRQRGQEGQGSRETSSSSTEQTVTTKSFIDELHGSRKKRSHKEDEDPEDEDDGKYKRPRNLNTDDDHSKRARHFACPFHKFDASTYSSGNADPRVGLKYRSCGPPGWPNMGKLK